MNARQEMTFKVKRAHRLELNPPELNSVLDTSIVLVRYMERNCQGENMYIDFFPGKYKLNYSPTEMSFFYNLAN